MVLVILVLLFAPSYAQHPYYVDFSQPQIKTKGVSLDSDFSLKWNAYYKVWRFESKGDHFKLKVNIPKDGLYKIEITHLSSAADNCPGGGYSPITVFANGKSIVSNYDVAEHHENKHGWVTDHWKVNLKKGSNTIEWVAGSICTHYWIKRIGIQPRSIGTASSNLFYIDLSRPQIRNLGLRLSPGYSLRWNSYYKVWRLERKSDGFKMIVNIKTPGRYSLVVTHLSSASNNCPGGGYSPVTITINGKPLATGYDVAENHGGTHGWASDRWKINLREGPNKIIWQAGPLCTHYWIKRIEIQR